MKMSDTFPKVFQVSGNPSFDVQDCKYIAYGESFRTTAQEDSAIAEAVLSHDALTERVKELEEALRLQVIDSKKVIDNLCNTGCDEAWSIIKLNNMITDANDALEKE